MRWLDKWGVLVPDTLAVASFAWGLGHMLAGGAASELADWDTHQQDQKKRFGRILTPMDVGGIPRSLTWRDLGPSRANWPRSWLWRCSSIDSGNQFRQSRQECPENMRLIVPTISNH